MIDRPTIGERYANATESSDLRVLADRRGDADTLIAAGWISEGFGTSLYRLRTEFDAVKGEHELAEVNLQRQLELARLAQISDDPDLGPKVAEAIRKQAKTDALTARLFVLSHLKTLNKARNELGAFALGLAYGGRCTLNPDEVLAIAGKVLEVFLDPTCHHCEGRCFNGGTHRGEPQVLCKPCRGTGKRREEIGRTQAERDFASRLLTRLDMAFAEVDHQLRRFLRNHATP